MQLYCFFIRVLKCTANVIRKVKEIIVLEIAKEETI